MISTSKESPLTRKNVVEKIFALLILSVFNNKEENIILEIFIQKSKWDFFFVLSPSTFDNTKQFVTVVTHNTRDQASCQWRSNLCPYFSLKENHKELFQRVQDMDAFDYTIEVAK